MSPSGRREGKKEMVYIYSLQSHEHTNKVALKRIQTKPIQTKDRWNKSEITTREKMSAELKWIYVRLHLFPFDGWIQWRRRRRRPVNVRFFCLLAWRSLAQIAFHGELLTLPFSLVSVVPSCCCFILAFNCKHAQMPQISPVHIHID